MCQHMVTFCNTAFKSLSVEAITLFGVANIGDDLIAVVVGGGGGGD